MPTTPLLGLPYPSAADPADVPLDMQELADRVELMVAPKPTWQAFAGGFPTMGDGTVTARYTRIGNIVHAYAHILIGSTTVIPSTFFFNLPTAAPLHDFTGTCHALDISIGWRYFGTMHQESSTEVALWSVPGAASGYSNWSPWGTSVPFTFAAGDHLTWQCWYEAA